MCHRFHCLSYDEVLDVIQIIESESPWNALPDWPAVRRNAYPNSQIPVIMAPSAEERLHSQDENDEAIEPLRGLFSSELTWGYEFPWQTGVIFNTRIESTEKPAWRESFLQRRCLVPCFEFFESHASEQSQSPQSGKPIKRPYGFVDPHRDFLIMGGIWQGDRCSVVTTQPNATVFPIHNRMPLVLQPEEIPIWLYGDFLGLADRSRVELSAEPQLPLYRQRQQDDSAQLHLTF